ncbi:MAG TPA: hypothetical protein V6D33_05275 [Cyanophyceae cyanobacterium]
MHIHEQKSNDLELAWLAGFIDGDGHISIVLNGKKFAPRISISNTDYPTLKIILDIINKNNFHKFEPTNKEPRKPNHNNSWKIATQGFEQCSVWVTLLTPYLKTKLEKANYMAEFIKLRQRSENKAPYTIEELNIAKKLITKDTKIYRHWEKLYQSLVNYSC